MFSARTSWQLSPIAAAFSQLNAGRISAESAHSSPNGPFISGALDSAYLVRFSKSECSERLTNCGKWGSAAPLGQATGSDLEFVIPRFESSRPSQAFRRFLKLLKKLENRPEIRAFRVSDSVSALLVQRTQSRNLRKSPVLSGNIPVLRRLSAETGLITTATGVFALGFDQVSAPG